MLKSKTSLPYGEKALRDWITERAQHENWTSTELAIRCQYPLTTALELLKKSETNQPK